MIHETAVIGSPPEVREWSEGHECFDPVIGDEVRISAFVTVDAGFCQPTRVGDGSFLMAHVHVGHDCSIGRRVEIAAGATLAGHVTVGDDAKIGVGASIRPYVSIGVGARIGAGAVVIDDVPAHAVAYGCPARPR